MEPPRTGVIQERLLVFPGERALESSLQIQSSKSTASQKPI